MTILLEQVPLWTDVWQTIASLISIPAAIVSFIILFIKDNNKENQIKKLSEIAENLKEMVADSEKRYIQTRKPIITIAFLHLEAIKAIKVTLINTNQQSQIQFYEPIDLVRSKYDISANNNTGEKQELNLLFYYDNLLEFDRTVIQMKYTTTEGYEFKQLLNFDVNNSEIKVYTDAILEIHASDY
jgi:hypothetical protein